MSGRTYKITVAAMMTALCVVCLYMAGVFPTGQAGFAAATVLFGAAAVMRTGLRGGAAVYLGTCLLGFALLPDKSGLLLYALFFGYYPVLKSLAERRRSRIAEWVVKLLPMELALAVLTYGTHTVPLPSGRGRYMTAALFAGALAVTVLFDVGVTKIITWLDRALPRFRGRK